MVELKDKIMIVDLDHLTQEQIFLFNANIDKALSIYDKMSSDLLTRSDELSWYVNNVTSRNTVFSPTLLCLRYILLLNEIQKTQTIEEIKVSNYDVARLLRQKYTVCCSTSRLSALLDKLKINIKSAVFCVLWSLGAIRCKSKNRIEKLKREGADIDIDIFRETNSYEDRYYGNVLDRLPEDVQKRCFYQVIYLLIPKKKVVENIVQNTKYKLVYLWDFLRPSDYFSAFLNTRKKFPKTMMSYEVEGYDMTPLLKRVSDDSETFYYFLAHLYPKVVEGMKRSGLALHLFIDWFENQAFDKSLHWAMNKYYKDVPVHAYMGLMADTKVNPITIATNAELNCNIAPKRIFVCNEALRQLYVQSGYKGEVNLAPFYRSQKVWKLEKEHKKEGTKFHLFVPFGIFIGEVMYKSRLIASFLKDCADMDIQVSIKMHPSNDASILRNLFGNDSRVEIVSGDFYEHLSKADAVIASNSSTTFEALSCGIPALYFIDPDNKYCLNQPDKVDDCMWYTVKDSTSFRNAISSIMSIPENKMEKLSNEIKNYYFQSDERALTDKLFYIGK